MTELPPDDVRARAKAFVTCRTGGDRARALIQRALGSDRAPCYTTRRGFFLTGAREVHGQGTREVRAMDSARRVGLAYELLHQAETTLGSRWSRMWRRRRLALWQAVDAAGLLRVELDHLNAPALRAVGLPTGLEDAAGPG